MQKYSDNANENVPLIVENVWYFFISFEIKVRTCSLAKKTKSYLINLFLYKNYFSWVDWLEIPCENVVLKITFKGATKL